MSAWASSGCEGCSSPAVGMRTAEADQAAARARITESWSSRRCRPTAMAATTESPAPVGLPTRGSGRRAEAHCPGVSAAKWKQPVLAGTCIDVLGARFQQDRGAGFQRVGTGDFLQLVVVGLEHRGPGAGRRQQRGPGGVDDAGDAAAFGFAHAPRVEVLVGALGQRPGSGKDRDTLVQQHADPRANGVPLRLIQRTSAFVDHGGASGGVLDQGEAAPGLGGNLDQRVFDSRRFQFPGEHLPVGSADGCQRDDGDALGVGDTGNVQALAAGPAQRGVDPVGPADVQDLQAVGLVDRRVRRNCQDHELLPAASAAFRKAPRSPASSPSRAGTMTGSRW